jgi:predicted nucleotidyltransferase
MTTAIELTPEELAEYQAAARFREQQEQEALAHKKKRAWKLARQAAALLRDQFNSTRVMAFGSLVREGCFTKWSDIDIAAWGIRPEDTFRAIGVVMDLDSEIEINLVDIETCSVSLRTTIEREGIEL